MDRIFKFRVYDGKQKKFIYFSLHNIIVPNRLLTQYKYPVQQFTGLLDKKGIEIFDGDIILGDLDSQNLRGFVEWNQAAARFSAFLYYDYTNKDSIYCLPEINVNKYYLCVIGNVVENDDLLK